MSPARCALRCAGLLAGLVRPLARLPDGLLAGSLARPLARLPAVVVAVLLAVFWIPGTASAEGPGYGGTADQLSVAWQPDSTQPAGDVVVSGVGFLAGSEVRVRVGGGTEQTTVVDETGTLQLTVQSAGSAALLPDGTSIMAVGQSPGGTTLTLVGFVPLRSGSGGGQSPTGQILMISVLLAGLASGLVPGIRGRLVVAVAGRLPGRSRTVRVERVEVEYAPRGYRGFHGLGHHGSKR